MRLTSMNLWQQTLREEVGKDLLPHLKAIEGALENLRSALGGRGRRRGGRRTGRASRPSADRLPAGHLKKCVARITGGRKDFSPAEVVKRLMRRPEFRGRNRNSLYVQVCKLKAR